LTGVDFFVVFVVARSAVQILKDLSNVFLTECFLLFGGFFSGDGEFLVKAKDYFI
jgi:hypothetical protein